MKSTTFVSKRSSPALRLIQTCQVLWLLLLTLVSAQAGEYKSAVKPATVIVNSRFGGQIFGFDIDPNGNEGVLSEALSLPDGNYLAAVETFDQTTGQIISVVSATKTQDDFVTMGVFASAGLIEYEHEISFLNVVRSFLVINPLTANRITGNWAAPIGQDHIVQRVSGVLGSSDFAVYAIDVSGGFTPFVFASNFERGAIGGRVFGITDEDFNSGADPGFAYDTSVNRAVLGHAKLGNPFVPGYIATLDLNTGAFQKFRGVGLGDVNGLAVDPASGTACTTTEIDFSVEFYNLATQTGFAQPLPGATNQFYSGADVEFDLLNKLFLVAQPNSSTAGSGSSIHVYTKEGILVESLNGFNFSNAGNVIPVHIAIKPSTRTGFVDGPDPGVRQIQSFTY